MDELVRRLVCFKNAVSWMCDVLNAGHGRISTRELRSNGSAGPGAFPGKCVLNIDDSRCITLLVRGEPTRRQITRQRGPAVVTRETGLLSQSRTSVVEQGAHEASLTKRA